jgi:hypothetical protein
MVHTISVRFTNTIGINVPEVEVNVTIRQSREPGC